MFCAEPCNFARAAKLPESAQTAVQEICMNGALLPHAELIRKCPSGLTPKQAAILAVIARYQGVVMSYDDLAGVANVAFSIDLTKVAARELVDKLSKRGFFHTCEAACEGIRQGKRYVLSEKCCPCLLSALPPQGVPQPSAQTAAQETPHPPAQTPPQGATQAPPHSPAHPPLLLKKKKNEEEAGNNFFVDEGKDFRSIPQEFLTEIESLFPVNWPNLVKIGFDFGRFLNAAKKAPDIAHLMKMCRQSLDFAEYAVSYLYPRGEMKTEKGEPVHHPCSWIFGCFRKSSDFPRPPHYKTREELAAEAILRQEQKRDEEACLRAFETWRGQFSPDELRELMNYQYGVPPEPLIRGHFKRHEWPKLKAVNLNASDSVSVSLLSATDRKAPSLGGA